MLLLDDRHILRLCLEKIQLQQQHECCSQLQLCLKQDSWISQLKKLGANFVFLDTDRPSSSDSRAQLQPLLTTLDWFGAFVATLFIFVWFAMKENEK